MPRPPDERAAADVFFAELTGQPLRRSPVGRQAGGGLTSRAGRSLLGRPLVESLGESTPPVEDAPVRSAVMNPGWHSWVVMVAGVPVKRDAPRWAGAIRQRTDYFSDYTGWEHRSESFTIDKLNVGTSLDILIAANVKGRIKGTKDALYVMEATVTASAPRDFSATRRKVGVIDVDVGFEDDRKKLRFAKASWDGDKRCARLDIPVRVTYSAKGLRPDEFTITWFGNGDPPITPFSPTP